MSSAIRLRSTTDPSRCPRSGATQPARSGERGPVSEPFRPLAFLLRNSTPLASTRSFPSFFHQAQLSSQLHPPRVFVPTLFFSKPRPLRSRSAPFSAKPRPLSTPTPPSRTCWQLPEGRGFRPIGDARTAVAFFLFPRRVKATAGGGGNGDRLLSLVEGQASGNRVPSQNAVVVEVAWFGGCCSVGVVVMVEWLALL